MASDDAVVTFASCDAKSFMSPQGVTVAACNSKIRAVQNRIAADPLVDALRDHSHCEENGRFPTPVSTPAVALSGSDWDEVDAPTPRPGPSHG